MSNSIKKLLVCNAWVSAAGSTSMYEHQKGWARQCLLPRRHLRPCRRRRLWRRRHGLRLDLQRALPCAERSPPAARRRSLNITYTWCSSAELQRQDVAGSASALPSIYFLRAFCWRCRLRPEYFCTSCSKTLWAAVTDRSHAHAPRTEQELPHVASWQHT